MTTWPLSTELDLARRVLELHQARDPERFQIALDLAVCDEQVPPLLLLPLVENAVTHGPARGARGTIRIAVRATDPVEVEIRNPGRYAGPRAGGTGLASVHDRLALAWGQRGSLVVRGEGEETIATVRWPRA